MNSKNKTTVLVLTALLTALVLVCTLLLKVPVGPDCYIHLGDAIVFLAVIILPRPNAVFAGSVGATLADLMGGFAFWAPATFIIRVVLVLVCGLFIDICKKRVSAGNSGSKSVFVTEVIGYLLSGAIGVAGYFVAEIILFGNWIPAAACVPLNCLQMYVGALLAVVISNALYRTNMSPLVYYHRPRK